MPLLAGGRAGLVARRDGVRCRRASNWRFQAFPHKSATQLAALVGYTHQYVSGSEQRRHANMVLKNVIEPVVADLGLIARRADQIDRVGLITQQIFEYIAKSRLCVADLSFNNPNAFYELGVRHMCKLPTVQMIRKGDKIPFDVSQGRTIKISPGAMRRAASSTRSATS